MTLRLPRKGRPKKASLTQVLIVETLLRTLGAIGRDQSRRKRELLPHLACFGDPYPSRERVLRAVMAAAPELGIPIASWNDGYFLIADEADVDACQNDLRGRIRALEDRIGELERYRPSAGRLF